MMVTIPTRNIRLTLIAFSAVLLVSGCGSVKIEAPDKPIDVNMNVNVQHKIEIDNKLNKSISDNKDLF